MRIKSLCLQLFFFALTALNIQAQERKVMLDSLAGRLRHLSTSSEKTSIYIRTSKDIYEAAEDLWFKAYAVDRQHQLLSSVDKTLYVQLVQNSNDSIVWEELYPIEKGIASGHIYLDSSLPDGTYWLCAYAAHSFDEKCRHFLDARKIAVVRNADVLLKKQNIEPVKEPAKQGLQFHLFPEGGQLLADVSNKVAFKAVSPDGLPCTVSGTLLENERAITSFASMHDGMGSFLFHPKRGKNYTVQLDTPFVDSVYQLQRPLEKGLSFRLLENRADSLVFAVYNKEAAVQPFYFSVQTNGLPSVLAAGEVKDSLVLKLPLTDARAGISKATLFDRDLKPLAERLVYIKYKQQLMISAKLSKERVGRKEKITLNIRTTDPNNKPVTAQLGAVIYDQLYHDPTDGKDIQTHYLLSNNLRGKVHNPQYYFDTVNTKRQEALDLLLLTQGWRTYRWSEQELAVSKMQQSLLLADSIKGNLIPKHKEGNTQQALLIFDATQRDSRLIAIAQDGRFSISPENMHIGNRIYIKHFGKREDYSINVPDPFEGLRKLKPWRRAIYPLMEKLATEQDNEDNPLTSLSRGAIKLEEVVINEKKEAVFRDKYIGHLDSLAKYENNTDRAHGGWLNCPAGDSRELPVEGKTYIVWTGPNVPVSHPFAFDATNSKQIVYHYPKYTEEELLKMFGIAKSKGYYPKKTFYEPVYDKEEKDTPPDYRNTLLWCPEIVTDKNGEATLEFFSSDINSVFLGIVEGIDENGALGKSKFRL